MSSLLPRPRWLYFFRKYRCAKWKGCVRVCPRGRLRWISFGLIHSAKRLESLLLLIHQITQKFKFNRLWLTRFNLHIFFNEVQMEARSPEKFLTLFSLKTVPRLSFFPPELAHHASTSWLHYGWGAGHKAWLTRVSTCAPSWRGETAALQLALITLPHQKQSGYNEEHISVATQ